MPTIPVRALLALLAAAAVLLTAVPIASALIGLPIAEFARDATAVADLHPLTGMLSNIGVLFWWTSASVWLFAAALYWQRDSGLFWFAAYSGLLSAYLALDDLFLIHEHLAPRYLGIAEELVYGLIALAVLSYLLTFRRLLLRSDGWLLAASLGFLAASVTADVVLEALLVRPDDWTYVVEDGLKWFGVFFWTGFCVARCWTDFARCFAGQTRMVRPGQADAPAALVQVTRMETPGQTSVRDSAR